MGDMADYYREMSEVYALEYGDDARAERAWDHRDHCRGRPILRTNSHTQQQFWGCSKFPKCRFSATRLEGCYEGWKKAPQTI
jgi:ssDNA-binding Zn-finger/Zn-ribbon topoisomerase 1